MSSFSDYLEDAVLDHVFRNTALTSPSTIYLALFTVAPTDAGGGTEVSGNGYARQALAFGAASGGSIDNSAKETFTASGGNFGTVVAVGFFDALTGGNMVAWDDSMADTAVDDGDSLDFPIGNITITLT